MKMPASVPRRDAATVSSSVEVRATANARASTSLSLADAPELEHSPVERATTDAAASSPAPAEGPEALSESAASAVP
eukprot:CAMPEP_0180525224 /NCGR_PEP_ID=MMETSP1036_2-20121128/59051_1 /TAXON_ID=632150 /ORGANISM="Azadinium spinosum, Strain 3D9" /LENGTH=76 /DNA_ID=CAMNT_0022538503 /DNA_START=72 /DNA_END=299 /DNA_ORIENTATION=-